MGLLTTIEVLHHFHIPMTSTGRHCGHLIVVLILISCGDRRRLIGWRVDNISLHRLSQCVDLLRIEIDQQVRIWRWIAGRILLLALRVRVAEDFVSVRHHGDSIVVILPPDLFRVVVDVHPVVATTGCAAVEECCMQAVGMAAHVNKGFFDLLGELSYFGSDVCDRV